MREHISNSKRSSFYRVSSPYNVIIVIAIIVIIPSIINLGKHICIVHYLISRLCWKTRMNELINGREFWNGFREIADDCDTGSQQYFLIIYSFKQIYLTL